MSIKLVRHSAELCWCDTTFVNVSDTEIKFSTHLKVISVFVP